MSGAIVHPTLSIVQGASLADELGDGALTIAGYLEEAAARYGEREAVVCRTPINRISWTYADLLEHSRKVAKALIASGLGKDGRVGVLMANRPEYLAAVFGVAMAGGVTVALSTFSTPPELHQLINDSAIQTLLFDERVLKQDFAAMLADMAPSPFLTSIVGLKSVTDAAPTTTGDFEDWDEFIAKGDEAPPEMFATRIANVTPADAGGIFFSSGTTSRPKGIVHAQRAFAIQWRRWPRVMGMTEPVRSWTGNGLFWSGNISMVVGTAFSTGGAAILQPTFDAEAALDAIEKERVTFLTGRPHQWARLHTARNWASADLSSLKYVTRNDLITEHPSVKTQWLVPMSFGTTETMTICTSTGYSAERIAAGPPLPGNTLKIVDRATGAPVPRGRRGEMCIKGPTLMLGYLGKNAEECFDAEGYYVTGDGGYMDGDGNFHWEGRLNDMIKTGGANVSPEEVDSAIALFPGVKRTQTIGAPDKLLGEIVVACIVPADGAALDEAALAAHLKERLASFKIPRRFLMFREEDFALTGNEKPKTADIRALAVARLSKSEEDS